MNKTVEPGGAGNGRHVFIVDDDEFTLHRLAEMCERNGIANVKTACDSREVLPFLAEHETSLVILDLLMPHLTGTELLPHIKQCRPEVPVVILTGMDDAKTAVEHMKIGAYDYLIKPVEEERLIACISKALELEALRKEVVALRSGFWDRGLLRRPEAFSSIITRSPRMLSIFQYIERVASSSLPLLITGETGVGKELIAGAVHNAGDRAGRFVAVNVAGLDDNLFADTVFGHEKGAYTGAESIRRGLAATAANGTLFLDEIGDLNGASQVKLLRLIEDKTYYPLGSDTVLQSSARIIAATNRDLNELTERGLFRKDLYYRLCSHQVHLPPLRERREDLPLLIEHFLEAAARAAGSRKAAPPGLAAYLLGYSFPGNIRELQGLINDISACCKTGNISLRDIGHIVRKAGHTAEESRLAVPSENDLIELMSSFFGHFPTISEVQDLLIGKALRLSCDSQRIAANLLGISRQGLNKRLNRKKSDHNLFDPPERETN